MLWISFDCVADSKLLIIQSYCGKNTNTTEVHVKRTKQCPFHRECWFTNKIRKEAPQRITNVSHCVLKILRPGPPLFLFRRESVSFFPSFLHENNKCLIAGSPLLYSHSFKPWNKRSSDLHAISQKASRSMLRTC